MRRVEGQGGVASNFVLGYYMRDGAVQRGLGLTIASLSPQADKEEQGHRDEPKNEFLPDLHAIPSLL